MSWDQFILDVQGSLPERLEALFDHQRKNFALFRQGEAGLATARSKSLYHKESQIIVQANPGRRKSTHARVDARSVSERPCFLCPGSMPADERGIDFGNFIILPNPYPVLDRHCTIPVREHVPQLLDGRIPDMLSLTRALGPGMLVFYNGARCGASAPDHFHLQACTKEGVPLFAHPGVTGVQDGVSVVESFARSMLLFAETDTNRLVELIGHAIDALRRLNPGPDEPMFNLLASFEADRFLGALFPRRRHRPERFFAAEEKRLAISPAALEMAGVLVVAEADHFGRVDEDVALSIYEEVSIERERFELLARELT